jgi:hypothetical protein
MVHTAFWRIIVGIAAAVLLTAPVGAQTGSIAGTIEDSSGAVIPNVSVTATNADTGQPRQTTSNAAGYYHFPFLPVGAYTIRVEAPGFRRYTRTGLTISVGEQVALRVQMEVGGLTETVTVEAESPLLNTRTSEVTALLDRTRMTELPLSGRNPIELAGLLPGVSSVRAPEFTLNRNAGPTISVAGSRGNHNSMLFDGSNHSFSFRNIGALYPSPDSIREFKVTSNLYSAEHGTSGGGVLNAVTHSGTNEFHGAVYEFLRNDNLNARDSFLPRKSNLIQNQFGFTSGGRIIRNRLFYFGSLEFLRTRPEASSVTTFPTTAAERQGDFSAGGDITDPLTRQPFPGRQIPLSRLDAVSRNVMERVVPLPNQPDGRFISAEPSPTDYRHYVLKADYVLNSKHTFYDRFFSGKTNQSNPYSGSTLPGYSPATAQFTTPANNVFSWTWVATSNKVNELRQSFLRVNEKYQALLTDRTLEDFGGKFPNIPGHPKVATRIIVNGRFTVGPGNISDSDEYQYELHDNFSWQLARHSLRMGGRWHHGFYEEVTYAGDKNGTFTFDRSVTGNQMADFFLGRPVSMRIISPEFAKESPGDQFGFYIQDDWRVSSHLTLNLGLRYELQKPWEEQRGWWNTLYRNSGFQSTRFPRAPIDMAFPGDPGVPYGLFETDKNNFLPRFGFAYAVGPGRKTVVRGGAGIFNELVNADIIQNSGQPWQINQFFFNVEQLSDPLRGLNVPLERDLNNPAFATPTSLLYPNPDYCNGYIYHYNLMVQRQIGNDWSLELGYIGKTSRKLSRSVEANPALYAPGATTGNIEQRRIFRPGIYSSLTEYSTSANGNYNSLQLEVSRRMARGFLFKSAYTYSKSLDDVSALTIGGPNPNPFNWKAQWGPSDFDLKHNANFSFVWELPKGGNSALHRIFVNGWELSGIFVARSGNPFTVLAGTDVALSGTGNQTANVVGNPVRNHANKADAVAQWFDRTAFARPATGTFGNSARNNVRGPGFWNLTSGVFRNVPVGERYRVQFRSEFFNIFNHTNLGTPNNTLSNTAFGRILSGSSPRVVQFALKFYY